jgi:hypothetical protein
MLTNCTQLDAIVGRITLLAQTASIGPKNAQTKSAEATKSLEAEIINLRATHEQETAKFRQTAEETAAQLLATKAEL